MIKRIVIFIILSTSVLLAGDKTQKQSPAVMADVTARGRALYEYDQAARHGTDAVLAMKPPKDWHPYYIAHKSDNGWSLIFGVLNSQRDRFEIVYEAIQGTSPQNFTAKKLEAPREDSGFYLAAAKAIDRVIQDFKGEGRPYNVAVLPATSDQLYVYVYPAQIKSDVYPIGGDVRYLVTADGGSIIEKRQLHKSIIEVPPSSIPKGTTAAGGVHTHVLSDVPEDTDILHVLLRQPAQPELIGTKNKKMYEISVDGTIREHKM